MFLVKIEVRIERCLSVIRVLAHNYDPARVACKTHRLPNGSRLKDGPAARRAVESVIGAPLHESPPAVMPTGITGQSFTYTGSARGRSFTVVVFDNPRATRLLLGRLDSHRAAADIHEVHSRNVVVLYMSGSGSSQLDAALKRRLGALR